MTRMYLSPTATTFAKIGLIFVEFLIGLYNLITFPIRKITFKAYGCISLISGILYGVIFNADIKELLVAFAHILVMFAAVIFVTRFIYNIFKKKVSKKIAYLISSPLGIPTNRFYNIETQAN